MNLDLEAIRRRLKVARSPGIDWTSAGRALNEITDSDVPALLAEVERLLKVEASVDAIRRLLTEWRPRGPMEDVTNPAFALAPEVWARMVDANLAQLNGGVR